VIRLLEGDGPLHLFSTRAPFPQLYQVVVASTIQVVVASIIQVMVPCLGIVVLSEPCPSRHGLLQIRVIKHQNGPLDNIVSGWRVSLRIENDYIPDKDGPVLTPLQLKVVEERLEINPLLLPVPEEEEKPTHLNWNMLMPASLVHRSDDHHQISWSKGRSEPATFPRITQLIIVSSHFPWRINVRAQDQEAGVTCGEVIDTIARSMDKLTSASEYNDLSKEKKSMVKRAYRHNRSRSADVPGGRLGEGMKRMDFLCDLTEFGGLEVDERIVQKTCSVALPGYVVLRCVNMKTPLEPVQTGTQTTIHNTIINHEVAGM
jgi:hypothetical protein